MPKINLYSDQLEFVEKIRDSLKRGHRSILGVASPAFGKTVTAGYIIESLRSKSDGSAWFLVHRKNLLRQTSKSFWGAHIEHGLITSGKARSNLPVQVGTIGTVFSRLSSLKPPKLVFIDEAHLSRGTMFETVIKWVIDSGGIVIGLTGTPTRLDGKSLGDLFTDMVEARSTKWLISQNRLSDYDMYSTMVMPDLSEVESGKRDYNVGQLADVMDNSRIVGDVISHWNQHAKGMITACYCVNVKHSISTAEQFNAAGIPAVHVDANTSESELKEACEGLASGKYKVVTCCLLLIEGFDLSAQVGKDITIECVILLRPTKSKARYLQMVFRALRKKPHAAIILDHAGCAQEFGLPDADQDWELNGEQKKSRSPEAESEVRIKTCPKCLAIFRPQLLECPKCGTVQETKAREIQVEDGVLHKVDKQVFELAAKARRMEQGSMRTLQELVGIGVRRGMKNAAGWGANVYASRENRKPTKAEFDEARWYARFEK